MLLKVSGSDETVVSLIVFGSRHRTLSARTLKQCPFNPTMALTDLWSMGSFDYLFSYENNGVRMTVTLNSLVILAELARDRLTEYLVAWCPPRLEQQGAGLVLQGQPQRHFWVPAKNGNAKRPAPVKVAVMIEDRFFIRFNLGQIVDSCDAHQFLVLFTNFRMPRT